MPPAPERHFTRARERLESRPFQPHPLLLTGHLQTIFGSRQRRKFPWGWGQILHGSLRLRSGAEIRYRRVSTSEVAPTLIAIHGMAGSSESGYMLGLSHKAFRKGWNCILLDLYNVNDEVPRPVIFHAGCNREMTQIVVGLIEKLSLERVFLVGVSLGGNILLKMLGEWQDTVPGRVSAAASISPLVDLTESWKMLDLRLSNRLYRHHYVSRLKSLSLNRSQHLQGFVDLGRLETVKTIRQFDEVLTVPLAGFEDVDDYYRRASARPTLGNIRVPTLVLHSRDDPFLPWRPLAEDEATRNPFLMVHLTEKGGHVAFLERARWDIDRSWAENRVIDYFSDF